MTTNLPDTLSDDALRGTTLVVRVAVHRAALEPPLITEIRDIEPAAIIESTFACVAQVSSVPPLALREIIENLIHAGFTDALVTVLDAGRTVRVSDRGPGINDPRRAMEPGYTTADEQIRSVVRGAGSGLALALGLVAAEGGTLDIHDNLGGGCVVTIAVEGPPAPDDLAVPGQPSDAQRRLLALLLEMAPAHPESMARELELPLGVVGRELVLLEHRGLVARFADGGRVLTERGAAIVATLF
jgi:anti-sigma regulatory factor (Ser/Thr protein kinase)